MGSVSQTLVALSCVLYAVNAASKSISVILLRPYALLSVGAKFLLISYVVRAVNIWRTFETLKNCRPVRAILACICDKQNLRALFY